MTWAFSFFGKSTVLLLDLSYVFSPNYLYSCIRRVFVFLPHGATTTPTVFGVFFCTSQLVQRPRVCVFLPNSATGASSASGYSCGTEIQIHQTHGGVVVSNKERYECIGGVWVCVQAARREQRPGVWVFSEIERLGRREGRWVLVRLGE